MPTLRVERVLGQGGMGIVVQATQLQLHRLVSVKFIRPEVLGTPHVVQRFLREAQAAVQLSSEHVALVLDVGTLETGAPYMVLEYLEGADLSTFPRSQLTVGVVVDLMLQACEALAEAHARGIVHCDIKPANFFTLGLDNVTRGDGGEGEIDRISALEDKVAMLQKTQDAVLAALKPVMFRASLGTPQTVPSRTVEVVNFDRIELDTVGAFDANTHQYVIRMPGQYIITATVGYMMMDKARANCEIMVEKPDHSVVGKAVATIPGNSSGIGDTVLRVASATIVQLAAGDLVYIRAYHDDAGDQMLTTDPRETNVQIILVPSMN
jgi:tRNA A-37 threonylcarbamoyl transferase component Bud32